MNISPLDVRNQVFKRKLKGYDGDEVKIFLDSVADCMEQLLKEKEALDRDNSMLREKLESYTEIESTLRDTLVTAQRIGEEAKANATKSADNIRTEAELEARRTISEATQRVREINKSWEDARAQTLALVVKLKSLLEAQLNFLGSIEEEVDKSGSLEGKGAGVYEDVSS